jgi:NAD(P)-dependent dehydrogenase (short-subunit alcohol dehydrogenase family)
MAPITQAIVIGAEGGLGHACALQLEHSGVYTRVLRLSRRSDPPLDLLSEPTITAAAAFAAASGDSRLVLDATGFLHDTRFRPERALRDIDPAHMAHAFAVNAIGPALLLKHFCPLLPRRGRVVFATLSARVGSIGDNRLGGWHSYRASKAALNQLVRNAAIELHRHNPDSLCVALHPGTVATPLSAPFAKTGLDVRPPDVAAQEVLAVIDALQPSQSGGFFDHRGEEVEW